MKLLVYQLDDRDIVTINVIIFLKKLSLMNVASFKRRNFHILFYKQGTIVILN